MTEIDQDLQKLILGTLSSMSSLWISVPVVWRIENNFVTVSSGSAKCMARHYSLPVEDATKGEDCLINDSSRYFFGVYGQGELF